MQVKVRSLVRTAPRLISPTSILILSMHSNGNWTQTTKRHQKPTCSGFHWLRWFILGFCWHRNPTAPMERSRSAAFTQNWDPNDRLLALFVSYHILFVFLPLSPRWELTCFWCRRFCLALQVVDILLRNNRQCKSSHQKIRIGAKVKRIQEGDGIDYDSAVQPPGYPD